MSNNESNEAYDKKLTSMYEKEFRNYIPFFYTKHEFENICDSLDFESKNHCSEIIGKILATILNTANHCTGRWIKPISSFDVVFFLSPDEIGQFNFLMGPSYKMRAFPSRTNTWYQLIYDKSNANMIKTNVLVKKALLWLKKNHPDVSQGNWNRKTFKISYGKQSKKIMDSNLKRLSSLIQPSVVEKIKFNYISSNLSPENNFLIHIENIKNKLLNYILGKTNPSKSVKNYSINLLNALCVIYKIVMANDIDSNKLEYFHSVLFDAYSFYRCKHVFEFTDETIFYFYEAICIPKYFTLKEKDEDNETTNESKEDK